MLEVHEICSTSTQAVHVAQLDERRRGVAIAEELQCGIPRAKRITYGLLPVGILVLHVQETQLY